MALPDKQSYALLGGDLVDYQPIEDPNTDFSAEASNELRADNAAMTRMIGRAFVAFTVSGGTVTVIEHDAVWGNAVSVKPTGVKNALGNYTITFPATVVDARGVTRSVNLRRGLGNVEQVSCLASVKRLSANSFQIFTFDDNLGGIADPTGAIVLIVW